MFSPTRCLESSSAPEVNEALSEIPKVGRFDEWKSKSFDKMEKPMYPANIHQKRISNFPVFSLAPSDVSRSELMNLRSFLWFHTEVQRECSDRPSRKKSADHKVAAGVTNDSIREETLYMWGLWRNMCFNLTHASFTIIFTQQNCWATCCQGHKSWGFLIEVTAGFLFPAGPFQFSRNP